MNEKFENVTRVHTHSFMKAEKIEKYTYHHLNPYPEIMNDLRYSDTRNYSIWLSGTELYNYMEEIPGSGLTDEGSFKRSDKELEKIRLADADWRLQVRPCFLYHDQELYYDDITEVLHLEGKRNYEGYDIRNNGKSGVSQRKVFRCNLYAEKADAFCDIIKNVSKETDDLLASYHIGNFSLSLRESEAYIYYEYCGNQYETDVEKLISQPFIKTLKKEAESYMIPSANNMLYTEFMQIFYSL